MSPWSLGNGQPFFCCYWKIISLPIGASEFDGWPWIFTAFLRCYSLIDVYKRTAYIVGIVLTLNTNITAQVLIWLTSSNPYSLLYRMYRGWCKKRKHDYFHITSSKRNKKISEMFFFQKMNRFEKTSNGLCYFQRNHVKNRYIYIYYGVPFVKFCEAMFYIFVP